MIQSNEDVELAAYILPLTISLAMWLACYYQAVIKCGKPNGFESIWISNLNSIVLCIMAALSLMEHIPERIASCWSISFFLVDAIDCLIRREVMWGFHAVISLVLNVLTASSSVHRGLRSASKGFFTEASTPFLNHWKTHKCFTTYLVFFISFTLCRIVWVPLFLYNTYTVHLDGKIDYLVWASILFYMLQLAWWFKMVGMLFHYKSPDEIQKEHDDKKKKN